MKDVIGIARRSEFQARIRAVTRPSVIVAIGNLEDGQAVRRKRRARFKNLDTVDRVVHGMGLRRSPKQRDALASEALEESVGVRLIGNVVNLIQFFSHHDVVVIVKGGGRQKAVPAAQRIAVRQCQERLVEASDRRLWDGSALIVKHLDQRIERRSESRCCNFHC